MTTKGNELKLDRTAVVISDLKDVSDEIVYWHSKTPQERLNALEQMRQIVYGYDPDTLRFQRVFEIITRE